MQDVWHVCLSPQTQTSYFPLDLFSEVWQVSLSLVSQFTIFFGSTLCCGSEERFQFSIPVKVIFHSSYVYLMMCFLLEVWNVNVTSGWKFAQWRDEQPSNAFTLQDTVNGRQLTWCQETTWQYVIRANKGNRLTTRRAAGSFWWNAICWFCNWRTFRTPHKHFNK